MNKKGFTLVELLAVIALLGLIVGIAVPSIMGVTSAIKKSMLDKKITMIEEAAILLGGDIKGSIISSNKKYNGNACRSYIVSDLVKGEYLDKDNDNECLTKDSTSTVGCVVDPSDSDNYLDKKEVIIYYKNKRIYAKVDVDDTLSCVETE